MRIVITGSKGQLGREVDRQLEEAGGHTLFLCDMDELDITDITAARSYLEDCQPELIINCAAYTAVDDCETNFDLAYRVNALGPRNLAIVAESIGAKLIHISTDYVFDGDGVSEGDGLRPYTEFDVTGPVSTYGASKLAGENFVKEFCSRYFIVRTAWLYGDGNNFVKTMLSLADKYPELKVVNDQNGSPTSTVELTRGLLSIMDTENYGLYHGTCEGQCTWYEFTREIFSLRNINTSVKPCASEEYPRPAKRPHWSVLDNMMFRLNGGYQFSHWKDAIKEYFAEQLLR